MPIRPRPRRPWACVRARSREKDLRRRLEERRQARPSNGRPYHGPFRPGEHREDRGRGRVHLEVHRQGLRVREPRASRGRNPGQQGGLAEAKRSARAAVIAAAYQAHPERFPHGLPALPALQLNPNGRDGARFRKRSIARILPSGRGQSQSPNGKTSSTQRSLLRDGEPKEVPPPFCPLAARSGTVY